METKKNINGSFYTLNLNDNFESFFNDFFIEWETVWIRKKVYVGTDLYKIKGNLESWSNIYKNLNHTCLIYQVNNKQIGCIVYKSNHDEAFIEELLIKSDFRGKGFGDSMVKEFFNYLSSLKIYKTIALETNELNISNKLYKNNGFKIKNKIKNDRENEEDTIIYNCRII